MGQINIFSPKGVTPTTAHQDIFPLIAVFCGTRMNRQWGNHPCFCGSMIKLAGGVIIAIGLRFDCGCHSSTQSEGTF